MAMRHSSGCNTLISISFFITVPSTRSSVRPSRLAGGMFVSRIGGSGGCFLAGPFLLVFQCGARSFQPGPRLEEVAQPEQAQHLVRARRAAVGQGQINFEKGRSFGPPKA